ncbi:MAG: SHOCT domain-containing protein [Acidimicrobiales bacterium]|jgi:putative membrane protein
MLPLEAVLVVNAHRAHILALLFIVLVVIFFVLFMALVVVVLFRSHAHPGRSGHGEAAIDPPELVLARRLASGEIDAEEYHRRLDTLHGRVTPPTESPPA